MSRRTGEQTKALLIETGIGMLLERGTTAGVSHIRLQEVVRRAGLTTGAAYRLWADQDAFHHDLAVGAARWRGEEPVANTLTRIGPLVASHAPLMEVIRQGGQAHVDGFRDENPDRPGRPGSFLVALALRATSANWVDLRDASVARHAGSVGDFARLYGELMSAYGLRMREPFTLEQFTLAMAALGEGFALQAIQGVDHPRVRRPGPDGVGDEWTLFGLAVWALVEAFMQGNPERPDLGRQTPATNSIG